MKTRDIFAVMLIVSLIFVIGCTKEVSEEELAKELNNLSAEELNYVLSDEEPPLAGQASKFISNKFVQLNSLRKTTKPYRITCSDSDGGANYTKAGYVTLFNYPGGTINKSDRCWNDGKRLQEYVCENGKYSGDHTFDCSSLGENYICEDSACIPLFDIVCNYPCALPMDYLEARKVGIKKSLLDLFNYTGSRLSKRFLPLQVHLTGDDECGEYFGTEMAFLDTNFHICLWELERYQQLNFPNINDISSAEGEDILTIHGAAHLLWKDKANVPYVFQEGFSRGVSHNYLRNREEDIFCYWSFEHQNPNGIVELTENFWFRLCDEFEFTDQNIINFFNQVENQAQETNRELTLNEVKGVIDGISGRDSTELFEEAGMFVGEAPPCQETDNGFDPNNFGNITYFEPQWQELRTINDECNGQQQIVEQYCCNPNDDNLHLLNNNNNDGCYQFMECENGCQEGKCVR